jgi:site-specific recombinase XerC
VDESFDLWAGYAASMRRRGKAAGTITKRRYELASWSAWIGAGWTTATWREVEQWTDSRPLGARAQASAVSHLREFYKWARREGLVTVDPCADVDTPKLPPLIPRPAGAGAVRRAVGPGLDVLEVASALMAYGGLRCCEVARLHWSDVDLAGGRLYVTGKGDRQAVVPIAPPLAAILAACNGVEGPVITGRAGQACSPARISQRMGAHLRRRNCSCTAHQLRHYAGTYLLELTERVELVQHFLRHASIATTQGYAKVADGALAAAVADW